MLPALTISPDMTRICAMTSGALTSAPMAFMMPADLPMTPATLDMPAVGVEWAGWWQGGWGGMGCTQHARAQHTRVANE